MLTFLDISSFSMFLVSIAGRACPLPAVDGPVEVLYCRVGDTDLEFGDESLQGEEPAGEDLAPNEGDDTYTLWNKATNTGFVLLDTPLAERRFVVAVYRTSLFTRAEVSQFAALLRERIERFAVEVPAETRSPDDSRYYAELVSLAHRCMPGKVLTCNRHELVVLHMLAHEHPALQARLDQML